MGLLLLPSVAFHRPITVHPGAGTGTDMRTADADCDHDATGVKVSDGAGRGEDGDVDESSPCLVSCHGDSLTLTSYFLPHPRLVNIEKRLIRQRKK